MQNPLDKWRTNQPPASPPAETYNRNRQPQPPPVPTAAPQAATNLKPYEAFRVKDRGAERLEIRRVLGESHAPSYRYLMDVSFNGDFGTELILIYSFLMVKIKGKQMQPLLRSILEGTCAFIQDFHPQEFSPPEPGAAIIESIEIIAGREAKE